MKPSDVVRILGPAGAIGTAPRDVLAAADPAALVPIRTDDGRSLSVPREALTPAGADAYQLDAPAGHAAGSPEHVVVPVVREELEVGTRTVDRGGVRIRLVPSERQEAIDIPLERREARVERIPIEREVDGPMPMREENGLLIVPVVEQVAVVQTKWILREEIRVRLERTHTHARENVTLRSESVVVERIPGRDEPGPGRQEPSGSTPAPDRRSAAEIQEHPDTADTQP